MSGTSILRQWRRCGWRRIPNASYCADLVARYNKDEAWERRSDAFARVSAHVAALIGAREGAAVIPLRG